jgi:integrase
MQGQRINRRSYGSGSLSIRTDRGGGETWIGRWRSHGKQVKRVLGPKRTPGTRDGLTRAQAERELRRAMQHHMAAPVTERLTVQEAGDRLIVHLEALGRRPSTIEDYKSHLRVHLAPFFGNAALDRIEPTDVEQFMAAKHREGKARKSTANYVGLLNSIFTFAEKRGWCARNPVRRVDRPRLHSGDARIRFLTPADIEALLRAVPGDDVGVTDRVMYLTAATTGLRQGELLALRWQDIDWTAGRVRVRESYVRGEFGATKSKRSNRSVPMTDRLARELDHHSRRSNYQADDDLVFCHPHTGKPMERSRLLKRFKAVLKTANVGAFVDVVGKDGKPDRKSLTRFHDLRHSFGTRMAAVGVPMRTLQEWMGHRDFATTLIYADYAPSEGERDLAERAFGRGLNLGLILSESEGTCEKVNVHGSAVSA